MPKIYKILCLYKGDYRHMYQPAPDPERSVPVEMSKMGGQSKCGSKRYARMDSQMDSRARKFAQAKPA